MLIIHTDCRVLFFAGSESIQFEEIYFATLY